MKRVLFGLIGVVGIATSTQAAVTWVSQVQVRNRVGGVDGAPISGSFPVTATGTYTFTVQLGIFNVQGLGAGQSNQGLYGWSGTVSAIGLFAGETLGVNPLNSRVSPFDFGPATSFGGTLSSPTSITAIEASRDIGGGAAAPWNWDTSAGAPGPQPTAPTPGAQGVNTFTSVFRFSITLTSFAPIDTLITIGGSAGPVLGWTPLASTPPTGPATPGSVSFLGLTRPVEDGGALAPINPFTFQLRMPAPGAAALLGLGGLVLVRRRSRPDACIR